MKENAKSTPPKGVLQVSFLTVAYFPSFAQGSYLPDHRTIGIPSYAKFANTVMAVATDSHRVPLSPLAEAFRKTFVMNCRYSFIRR